MENEQPDISSFYETVRNQVRRYTGMPDLADDITQDAYLRAYKHIRARGPPRNPLSWMLAISRNIAHDYVHGYKKREHLIEEQRRTETTRRTDEPSAIEVLLEREEKGRSASAVREAVASLSKKDKELVEGYYFNNTGSAVLAQQAKIPKRLLRNRLFRARDRLRRQLSHARGTE